MQIDAPASWQSVDFISDLHLIESAPATQRACEHYLQQTPADALFILGDLFEVWVGDDALLLADAFLQRCVAMLHAASRRMPVYIMAGNRDFLMGEQLMAACGASALDDPSVLCFDSQRWLLSHGDALCLDDLPYQAFRAEVRSPAWQSAFLARPLPERQAIAREIRARSENEKQTSARYTDLDNPACAALMHEHQATQMIHGHTHQPAEHVPATGLLRTVLSDWDLDASVPRAQVLRLSRNNNGNGGAQPALRRLSLQQALATEPRAAD